MEPPPQYDGDLFLGIGAATVGIGFVRMNLELTAGLAAIGPLNAIYHPIVTVMLVAHARVGCEVGINKVWALSISVFWNDRTNSFWYINATYLTNCDLLAEKT